MKINIIGAKNNMPPSLDEDYSDEMEQETVPSKDIFIENTGNITQQELEKAFQVHGDILGTVSVNNLGTKYFKMFFATAEDAKNACAKDQQMLNNKRLRVTLAGETTTENFDCMIKMWNFADQPNITEEAIYDHFKFCGDIKYVKKFYTNQPIVIIHFKEVQAVAKAMSTECKMMGLQYTLEEDFEVNECESFTTNLIKATPEKSETKSENSEFDMNLYVGNLHKTTKANEIRNELFKMVPTVKINYVDFKVDNYLDSPSKIAYIKLKLDRATRQYIISLNQSTFKGRQVQIFDADEEHMFHPDTTIMVNNLNEDVTEKLLYDKFQTIGKIECVLKPAHNYAYIAFKANIAETAFKFDKTILGGQVINVLKIERKLDMKLEPKEFQEYKSVAEKFDTLGLKADNIDSPDLESNVLKLHVSNIPRDTLAIEIVTYFRRFADVMEFEFIDPFNSCYLTKSAYVSFSKKVDAEKVFLLGPHQFQGTVLQVTQLDVTFDNVRPNSIVMRNVSAYLTTDEIYHYLDSNIGKVIDICRSDTERSHVFVKFQSQDIAGKVCKIDKIGVEVADIKPHSEDAMEYDDDFNNEESKTINRILKDKRISEIVQQMRMHESRQILTSGLVTTHLPDKAFEKDSVQIHNCPKNMTLAMFRNQFKRCGNIIDFMAIDFKDSDAKIVFLKFESSIGPYLMCENFNQTVMQGKHVFIHKANEKPLVDKETAVLLIDDSNALSVEAVYNHFIKLGKVKFVLKLFQHKHIVQYQTQKGVQDALKIESLLGKRIRMKMFVGDIDLNFAKNFTVISKNTDNSAETAVTFYLGNLEKDTTEKEIRTEFFEKEMADKIIGFEFKLENCMYTPTKVAFVTFKINSKAKETILEKHNKMLKNRRVLLLAETRYFTPKTTIIVRGVKDINREDTLYEHFKHAGDICVIQKPCYDYAYVSFKEAKHVAQALLMSDQPIKGHTVKVDRIGRKIDMRLVRNEGPIYADESAKHKSLGLIISPIQSLTSYEKRRRSRYQNEANDSDETKLIVDNIPRETTLVELVEYFRLFGKVTGIRFNEVYNACMLQKSAFINVLNVETAKAIYLHPAHQFQGTHLNVTRCMHVYERRPDVAVISMPSTYLTDDEIYTTLSQKAGPILDYTRGHFVRSNMFIKFKNTADVAKAVQFKSIANEKVEITLFNLNSATIDDRDKDVRNEGPISKTRVDKQKKEEAIMMEEKNRMANAIQYHDIDCRYIPRPEFHYNSIQINNCPKNTTWNTFQEYFAVCGKIMKILLVNLDQIDSGIAFIRFEDTVGPILAKHYFDQRMMRDKRLFIYSTTEMPVFNTDVTIEVEHDPNIIAEDIYNRFKHLGALKFVLQITPKRALVQYRNSQCATPAEKINSMLGKPIRVLRLPSALYYENLSCKKVYFIGNSSVCLDETLPGNYDLPKQLQRGGNENSYNDPPPQPQRRVNENSYNHPQNEQQYERRREQANHEANRVEEKVNEIPQQKNDVTVQSNEEKSREVEKNTQPQPQPQSNGVAPTPKIPIHDLLAMEFKNLEPIKPVTKDEQKKTEEGNGMVPPFISRPDFPVETPGLGTPIRNGNDSTAAPLNNSRTGQVQETSREAIFSRARNNDRNAQPERGMRRGDDRSNVNTSPMFSRARKEDNNVAGKTDNRGQTDQQNARLQAPQQGPPMHVPPAPLAANNPLTIVVQELTRHFNKFPRFKRYSRNEQIMFLKMEPFAPNEIKIFNLLQKPKQLHILDLVHPHARQQSTLRLSTYDTPNKNYENDLFERNRKRAGSPNHRYDDDHKRRNDASHYY